MVKRREAVATSIMNTQNSVHENGENFMSFF